MRHESLSWMSVTRIAAVTRRAGQSTFNSQSRVLHFWPARRVIAVEQRLYTVLEVTRRAGVYLCLKSNTGAVVDPHGGPPSDNR